MAGAPVEQLRKFSEAGLIAGTLIHGTISILVGVLYAIALPMFPHGASWRSGQSHVLQRMFRVTRLPS